jgi:hypothetical protein
MQEELYRDHSEEFDEMFAGAKSSQSNSTQFDEQEQQTEVGEQPIATKANNTSWYSRDYLQED